jgi:hypothetical protein
MKKKEGRLLIKPKLTIGMNEKISIFTKYMKHCFMDAF